MKQATKQAINKLNQIIDDYINIFHSDKKEVEEIEHSLKTILKKIKKD